jgi:DNA primase
MSLHQAGFDTAVASMGTALTQQQAKAIKNYTNNVYISYDGDSAGQKATMRGLDILAECGLNVKVVSLPDGLDPDDVIKKYGREGYLKLLREADTLPAFKIKVLKNDFDINTPDGKSKFTVEALKVVAKMENPVEKEEYLKVIHSITGYSMDALRQQVGLSERKIAEKKAEEGEAARKRRLESVRRIAEENKRIEEMKARKAKMLAEMEKQRRIEEVGYDEEEVARQKAEEEARLKAEEEAELAEQAELERQLAEMKANQAELDAKNKAMQAKKMEEERRARNKRNLIISVAALVFVVLSAGLTFYFVTKKAPDYYTLADEYLSIKIEVEAIPQTKMTDNAYAMNMVTQEAPKAARTTKGSGTKKQNNEFAVTNVFSTGGGIVK